MPNHMLTALFLLEGDIDYPDQIVRGVKRLILDGTLCPGERLPAVLEAAEYFTINPSVFTLAYKRLAKDGYIAIMFGKGGQICKGVVSDPP